MIRPSSLKKGDRIRIVAPARKISLEELKPALDLIEEWGFEATFTENLFAINHQFAGSDSNRTRDFQNAIDDPQCQAILCARGGYGSVRIIDNLNFQGLNANPKWLIGFSDFTVFHSALNRIGHMSLHASMPISFKDNSIESLNSLKAAIDGDAYEVRAKAHPFNCTGVVKAPIVGGNLSMLYSLLGSQDSLDLKGKILFLEDLDEYLYHIDRMMFNLKRNAYLDKPAGILIGAMSDMNDNQIPFGENAEEILDRHFQELNIPIGFGIPAGHLNDNQALIFGLETEVRINSQGTQILFPGESSKTWS